MMRWRSYWQDLQVSVGDGIYRVIQFLELEPFFERIIEGILWTEDKIAGVVAKFKSPKMVREVESELRRADIRRGLDEDLGIEGDTWVDEEAWHDDTREWWLRDQDNPGDR